MKKILVGFLLIAVLLAACSGGNAEGNNTAAVEADTVNTVSSNDVSGETASGDAAPSGQAPDFSKMELPLMSQLMIGTFMLEDTEYAVDAEQAADLLPLWQVLNNLLNSDTAANQEVDAVVAQIEKTMTAEQLQAIADMSLNNESSMGLIQELGLDMQQREDSDFEMPTGGGAMGGGPGGEGGGPGGDMPAGGGDMGGAPAGGDFSGGDTSMSQEDMEAIQATREAGGGGGGPMGGGNRMNTMLIDPLIELLEGKIS